MSQSKQQQVLESAPESTGGPKRLEPSLEDEQHRREEDDDVPMIGRAPAVGSGLDGVVSGDGEHDGDTYRE